MSDLYRECPRCQELCHFNDLYCAACGCQIVPSVYLVEQLLLERAARWRMLARARFG